MPQTRQALSEGRIIEAAMSLLEERGVDGLTMRALSDRLGVALGATYKHVPNKHELLKLVARALYAEIGQVECDGDGQAQAKAVMIEIRRVLGRYQGMAAYMGAHMSEFQSAAVVAMVMDPLRSMGLTAAETEELVLTLVLFTAGHLLVDIGPAFEIEAAAAYEKGIDLLLVGALTLSSQHR
jgi:AcrR family transcriptional regulator